MSFEGLTEGRVIGHGDVRQVVYGDSAANHYEWKYIAVKQGKESADSQRPIFKQVLYCFIHLPGGKNVVPKEFKEETPDKLNPFFAMHPKAQRLYDLFRAGVEKPIDGTPIDLWPGLDEGQKEEFKAQRIYTIEQVAAASDTTLQVLGPGARTIKGKAQAFLDNAKNAAAGEEVEKLRAELAALRAELVAGKDQPAPKRGRVKKEKENEEVTSND